MGSDASNASKTKSAEGGKSKTKLSSSQTSKPSKPSKPSKKVVERPSSPSLFEEDPPHLDVKRGKEKGQKSKVRSSSSKVKVGTSAPGIKKASRKNEGAARKKKSKKREEDNDASEGESGDDEKERSKAAKRDEERVRKAVLWNRSAAGCGHVLFLLPVFCLSARRGREELVARRESSGLNC